ncbi:MULTISPECIES: flagellar biosynthesis protein FlhF [Marinobacter]|jgi:flagellar biosynthesis protein FlhF|uniref:flagellar biosynthesis protein FlhF n=1 Tax=Marinobacter TaxID=2742 RepID=UPI00125C087B|nr:MULTISPECIES: flagellar biosynthesis protein FlhF [Marinobacter]MCZ4286084.1 flagellar biosynthesis protein FlhF [Marinobacter salarius]MDC8456002.1 flagellar biosynthesis protein FlhF [Marinobacter sp. DS40M6]VVT05453.1 Flagellar GTP-binding protein [Marinobacter salarius]VXC12159.1 Flagellar biosynthesis protein FlhF [Marinobacter salarius]
MKVKRFFAQSMAEALRQVRDQMGPDAVILSNRRVDGGVEIVTALDYDENMARQRLGDAAREATNGSRLAEMQAEQHRRLEDELGRSRDRIREVREKRATYGNAVGGGDFGHAGLSKESLADDDMVVEEPTAAYSGELAQMRAEISSLRDLVSARNGGEPEQTAVNAVQQRLSERLQEFGLGLELANSLSRRHRAGRLEDGWKQSLKMLAAGVKTARTEWADEGGVYALVGPTGSGKTTTIGKLAAHYVLRHGADSLALVTTDRYRVAAHEQLFVFGRILNVPVRVVDETHSLDDILDELSDRHLVLIDTAGLTSTDKGYEEQLMELARSHHRIRTHLVVSATSQPRIMKSVWHCYKMANLTGCVMTKIDEALTLGESLGFVMETGLPVAYYTDGQKIPEDLHHAESIPLVRLAVERLKKLQQQQAVAV